MALTEDQLAWLQRNRSISGGAAGSIIPSGQASPIMPSGAAEQGESSEAADAGDETASLPPDDGDAGAPAPLSSDEDADAMVASSEDSGAEMPTESSDDTGFDTSAEPPDEGSADTSVEASDDTGFDPSVEPPDDGSADTSVEASDDTGFDPSVEPPDDGSADTSVEASDDTGFDPSVEPQDDGSDDTSVEASDDTGFDTSVESSDDGSADTSVEASDDTGFDPSVEPPDDGSADTSVEASDDTGFDPSVEPQDDGSADTSVEASDDTGFDTSVESSDDGSADASVEASDDTGFDPSVELQDDGNATAADTSSDADASPPVAGLPTGATSGRGIVPVERTFETPSLPFNLKYITGTFGLSIKLKGSLEATGGDKGSSSVDVTPGGYSDGGFIERLGHTWYSSEGVRIFGLNTGASESKVESQAKVKDGLEVSISASLKWANGEELKLKFTVVKIGGDWKVTGGALQGDYVFKAITIPIFSFEGAKFKGTAQAVASVKAQPNYAAIAASLGEAGGTAAAAGRAIAAFITFDGLIALGFVAGGVIAVVGAVKALAEAAETGQLPGVVQQTASALKAGFVAGVKGLPNSAGSIGQPGYDMGVKAFAEARGNVLKKVPDATDEEIHEVVNDLVTGKEGEIYELVKPTAQKAVWKAWASSRTSWFDSPGHLKRGWAAIYNKLPKDDDPDFKEYSKR